MRPRLSSALGPGIDFILAVWYYIRMERKCVDCTKPIKQESTRCRSCAIRWRYKHGRGPRRLRLSRVREMTSVEAAWVGAMLEGEGSIAPPYRGQCSGIMTIYSTEVETIATCLRLVGDGGVQFRLPRPTPERKSHKPQWMWVLTGVLPVQDFLRQVVPYLTSKRDRAERVIDELAARKKSV